MKIKISIRDISLIAFLSVIIVISQKLFAFIPGLEIVTFLVITYSIFLPFKIWFISINIFILITGITTGFNVWLIVYFPLFLCNGFFSWLLKKLLQKNVVFFSIWNFICGFSIIFYYFIFDYILFGSSIALASFSTAIFFNLLGGTANFTFSLITFKYLKNFLVDKRVQNLYIQNNFF